MKSWGLKVGKCKPNSSSYEGDLIGMDGTWNDSSDYIRKVDGRSIPLEWSSETLGGICVQSGSDGILLKGSNDKKSSDCKAEEEEKDGWSLLLELTFRRIFSRSDRGLTKSDSEWDLVCLKGVSLGQWSRQVKDFNLSRPLITLKE